jgi:predicted TIM-barrel fold metal-dependent hydrolase
MDEEYDNFASQIGLSLKPSEYWTRQGYTTFQNEALTKEVINIVGVDNIIWGSDYPHPDGIWPDSLRIIEQNLGHLDQPTLSKLIYDNTKRLYLI